MTPSKKKVKYSINTVPMKNIDTSKNHIYYEEYKYADNDHLRDFVDSDEIETLTRKIEEKVIFVLGWDGTMLSAISKHLDSWLPFLWINFWHKGFLLNDKKAALKASEFISREYPILECSLEIAGEKHSFYAFNEIDIRSANGRIITLEIIIWGNKSIHIAWDGIVISTPAWSTGYNSSLGGPILPHQIDAFVITPKAPWKPKGQGPILIPQSEVIQIQNIGRQNALQIYGDSNEIAVSEQHTVSLVVKKSDKKVRFLIAKNYIEAWDAKVMQEQGFNV